MSADPRLSAAQLACLRRLRYAADLAAEPKRPGSVGETFTGDLVVRSQTAARTVRALARLGLVTLSSDAARASHNDDGVTPLPVARITDAGRRALGGDRPAPRP